MTERVKPINAVSAAEGARHRAAIVEAIAQFWDDNGHAPTRAQVAETVGLSLKSTKAHVGRLLTEGKLTENGPGTLAPK